jgi:hypothetical protein
MGSTTRTRGEEPGQQRTGAPSNGSSNALSERPSSPWRARGEPSAALLSPTRRSRAASLGRGRQVACTNVADSAARASPRRRPAAQARPPAACQRLDVGIAPAITRSGAWASIHGPGRTGCPPATTMLRSCGPVRRPESGSARIGRDTRQLRGRRQRGSSSGPATMRPARPTSRPATRRWCGRRGSAPRHDICERLGRGSTIVPAARPATRSRKGTLTDPTRSATATARLATAAPAWRRPHRQQQLRSSRPPVEVRRSIVCGAPRSHSSPPVGREQHEQLNEKLRRDHRGASRTAVPGVAGAIPRIRADPSAKKPAARSSSHPPGGWRRAQRQRRGEWAFHPAS